MSLYRIKALERKIGRDGDGIARRLVDLAQDGTVRDPHTGETFTAEEARRRGFTVIEEQIVSAP